MKALGIVRNIDALGRVVIPKETRTILDIKEGDPVEFYTDDDCVMIKKYTRECIFCGNVERVTKFKGANICIECFNKIEGIL